MDYAIFEKLCEIKNVTPYKVSKETGVSTATLSSWKVGRYEPKLDKIQKLADYLGVTSDYLAGKTDSTICPVCYFLYDPTNEYQEAEHKERHEKFLKAREKYGEILPYAEATEKRNALITRLQTAKLTDNEIIETFNKYVDYDFMLRIYQNDFALGLDRDQHACDEVEKLSPNRYLSEDVINKLRKQNGLSPLYFDSNSDADPTFTAKNDAERRLLVLFRNTDSVPDSEREEIVEHFEKTIDLYLKARGVIK